MSRIKMRMLRTHLFEEDYLSEENAVKEQFCLGLVLCDVCVGMHAEHVWMLVDWQRLCVLNVSVILKT